MQKIPLGVTFNIPEDPAEFVQANWNWVKGRRWNFGCFWRNQTVELNIVDPDGLTTLQSHFRADDSLVQRILDTGNDPDGLAIAICDQLISASLETPPDHVIRQAHATVARWICEQHGHRDVPFKVVELNPS